MFSYSLVKVFNAAKTLTKKLEVINNDIMNYNVINVNHFHLFSFLISVLLYYLAFSFMPFAEKISDYS